MHGERDCNAPHLPHLLCLLNNGTLLLWFSGFLPGTFPIVEFLIPSPRPVSAQPSAVLSLDLLSKLHVLALSLCPCQQHMPQAGIHRAVAWTICVGLTLFFLTQISFCTLLWALKALFLSQLISPPVKMFLGYRNVSSPLATLPHRGTGPFLLPLFFSFSLFHLTWLHEGLFLSF